MSYGPNPWQQTQWDWRAAGNFIGGGGGGGLILWAALASGFGVPDSTLLLLMLGGMALVGAGLACVWLELGRPLRALHVFINPRTSWMTREAFTATLLMPAALAAAVGLPGAAWLAGLLALAFVYCQARMLRAAKGIPAWRAPLTVPLILLTGAAEGGGWLLLLMAAAPWPVPRLLLVAIAVCVLARMFVWRAHRRSLAGQAAPRALAALDATAGGLQIGGTALPLAAMAAAAVAGGALATPLLAAAGLLAALAGAWLKFTLITRAGFNQGFALVHLPVRGVPR